jgi:hypothetical protein
VHAAFFGSNLILCEDIDVGEFVPKIAANGDIPIGNLPIGKL